MPRRRLLIASAATLPLLLATTGCRSADLFAGPDPLGGRPPLAPGTVVLEAAIAAEVQMISRYRSVMSAAAGKSASRGVLAALLAQHEQHLVQLRARLIVPAGASASQSPSASGSPGSAAPSGSPGSAPASSAGPETIAGLRAAERQSAATLLRQLVIVEPALAQLLASIAASDATHVSALAAL
jgi:hypothetical protein